MIRQFFQRFARTPRRERSPRARRSLNGHCNWERAEIDAGEEHLAIYYGRVDEGSMQDFPVVARVGRPGQHRFPVQVICDNDSQRKALQRELGFYLDQLPADRGILSLEDIWEYQLYHCTTYANIYGDCHWTHKNPP